MLITIIGLILFDLSEWIKDIKQISEAYGSSTMVTAHKLDYG